MRVKLAKTDPGDVLLIPGDIHFDQQDDAALHVMLLTAQGARVNSVCLIGDTFESAGISRHKSMRAARHFRNGKGTFKSEKEAAEPWLRELKSFTDPGKCNALTGNHEAWWGEVQDEYPGLMDTEWYELYGDLFDGWHLHDEDTSLKYGPLLVSHGHRLRGSLSRNSAATVLGNYPGQNTAYGHTHRIDEATTPTFKYGKPVAHGAWTFGALKDREAELSSPKIGPFAERHAQGFGIVTFFNRNGSLDSESLGFEVTKCRIHRDDRDRPFAVFGGEVYK